MELQILWLHNDGFLDLNKDKELKANPFVAKKDCLMPQKLKTLKKVFKKQLIATKHLIFSMQMRPAFFKCSSNRTLALKNTGMVSGKFSKERATILFCTSMVGEKLPLLIIGKSKNLQGLKNLNL